MQNQNGSIHNLPLGTWGDQPPASEQTARPSDGGNALAQAEKLNQLIGGGVGPAFQLFGLVVPGSSSSWLYRFPYIYDYLTFWFPTAPAAALRFGPSTPVIPVSTVAAITIPGTALEFQFDNPNAGAYTLTVFAVRGLPPVVINL